MADVRALLAAERQSRRITHPHLTYSKNGALTCNICNLNIKSEQLWPGHLKSLNHRKNVQRISDTTATRPATKRKIDSLDDDDDRNNAVTREHEVDSRKKPRSASQKQEETNIEILHLNTPPAPAVPQSQSQLATVAPGAPEPEVEVEVEVRVEKEIDERPINDQHRQQQQADVNEDEWAAFERDVAGLARADYTSGAVIEAAPVTAADVAQQQQQQQHSSNRVQEREEEAEAEKEEESRRLEEEFEVMEEMEERVQRLRERREALRSKGGGPVVPNAVSGEVVSADDNSNNHEEGDVRTQIEEHVEESVGNDDDDDDDDSSEGQIDGWYG